MRSAFTQGEQYVWLTSAAVAVSLLMGFTLLTVILYNGLGFMWPADLRLVTLQDGSKVLGEVTNHAVATEDRGSQTQFKVGNRRLYNGADFRWIHDGEIVSSSYPADAVALERMEYGNFYGFLRAVQYDGTTSSEGDLWQHLQEGIAWVRAQRAPLAVESENLSKLANRIEALRRRVVKMEYEDPQANSTRIRALNAEMANLRTRFERINQEMSAGVAALRKNHATLTDAAGTEREVELIDIVRSYRPNQMGTGEKLAYYGVRLKELLLADPRESNTEGGLFPAIFGTVTLVFIMSIFSVPMGVVTAIYLREYAREGILVRLVRIAVYNLAGVPSIVFGIFGLGFFIYGVGGTIDRVFYPELLPTPTFGTGGILWASLTLALLTVPVVIVATEEGLTAIPRGLREASLALGATRFQTLMRVVLPMAMPGIITGFILAMARAAGETAPLMITGVVKLAPTLPIDGTWPFVHLERKFMHLGFHIYDVGFQSPNAEAAKPMVYVTTLLLILIVVVLGLASIRLRNNLRRKFRTGAF